MEGETSSAGEDDWNTIHSVKQKIHSTRSTNNIGQQFFTVTALVNTRNITKLIRHNNVRHNEIENEIQKTVQRKA